MKILNILLTFFIMFGADSVHSTPYMNRYHTKPFNSKHELTGIGYQNGNYSASCNTFVNSYYNRSRAFSLKYMIRNIGANFTIVDGYFKKPIFIGYPVLQIDYKNLFFEISFIPPVPNHEIGVLMITKNVTF